MDEKESLKKEELFKGLIFSILSAFCYAFLAIFVKMGYLYGMDTTAMLTYRFLTGFAFMATTLLILKPRLLIPATYTIPKSFLLGFVIYTTQSFCFFYSLKYVSAPITELLLYLYPATVTALACIAFKEKLSLIKIAYITIMLTGFTFLFHDAFHSPLKATGITFGLGAMFIYSAYLIIIQKIIKNENPLTLSLYTLGFTGLSFLLFAHHPPLGSLNQHQILVLIGMGIISTSLAILFLYLSIELIGSSLTSIFSSIEPVITIFLSIAVLKTTMNTYQDIGAALIILGIFIANAYHRIKG